MAIILQALPTIMNHPPITAATASKDILMPTPMKPYGGMMNYWKKVQQTLPGKVPLLSRADFNCPGDGKMMLDGKASKVNDQTQQSGDVDLDKTNIANFTDEWDFVIENYITGANNPDVIDSIEVIIS